MQGSSPLEKMHIAIIGGGTAGWMTAATLRRRLGCRITLVESARTPTIGVGEATIPSLVDWIENMGIDEEEFLRRTGGTYKLGIRFDNWITPGHRYWHPFGICGGRLDGIDIIHFWQRGLLEGWIHPSVAYTDFSIQRLLSEDSRAPYDKEGVPLVANYAYHLEASKLAIFLQEIATREGVERRIGEVLDATIDSNGDIETLRIEGQEGLVADLYIDCSGFHSVIIEKRLGVRWIDWSDQLLCDRAVVCRRGEESESFKNPIRPYTISTGLSAGWGWEIPLQNNVGHGYVYSSRFIDAEQAKVELLRHAGLSRDQVEPRELKMRIGRRERCWTGNCVAIGLSAGFIEPLESTGIYLVQQAIDDLVDCLSSEIDSAFRLSTEPPSRSEFNLRMERSYEEIRDFVLLHYVLSERRDTPFWNAARTVHQPESLRKAMIDYELLGQVVLPSDSVFVEANHHFIYQGAGRIPASNLHSRKEHPAWRYRKNDIAELMQRILVENANITQSSMSHQEQIRRLHSVSPTPQIRATAKVAQEFVQS